MKLSTIAAVWFVLSGTGFAQSVHYLDCSRPGGGDSLRPESAWGNIEQANAYVFRPGDRLLLHRGSRCEGMLAPKGSGAEQAPIQIGAYGEGSLPIVDGRKQRAGLQLFNQEFWDVEDLEIVGGDPYGVHIGADRVSIRHIHLRDLVIHGVTGEPKVKESGLLVVAPAQNSTATIGNVLVDGVTAYDTTQWAGILVAGASYNENKRSYGDGVTIRNSVVHDVAGDGILLETTRHGLIEHNVAWDTGMQETETIGTPNAIWEWMCADCRVAWNEGFFSDSPGVDGGVFDIDYGNTDNIVEHNFAHDSQGYCAAIFGAEGRRGDSVHSIVRENTCLHNGRSPRLALRQGAIFLKTWHGGQLNGIEVTHNTILWEPPLDAPAIRANAEFFGDLPNRIQDNRILLAAGSAIDASPAVHTADNSVCGPRSEATAPGIGAATDMCSCWKPWRDPWAKDTHVALKPDVGLEFAGWRLATTISTNDAHQAARAEVVLLESMVHQFDSLGLKGVLWPQAAIAASERTTLRADWNLSSHIEIAAGTLSDAQTQHGGVFLVNPEGAIVARWQAPVDTAQVWLELQHLLGTPVGMQSVPWCVSRQEDKRSNGEGCNVEAVP